MGTSFSASFGKPRLVTTQGESAVSAGPRASTVDPALGPRANVHDACALPSTLVDQLADALGVAEARCATNQRMNGSTATIEPAARMPEAPPYINAESAPFLQNAVAHGLSPPQRPPPTAFQAVQTATPVQLWIAQQARRDPHQSHLALDYNSADTDHGDADLPRFFDRNRRAAQRTHPATHSTIGGLSPPSMACGFVLGLAVIVPTLWLLNADTITDLATHSAPLALASPLLSESAVATLVPTTAYEIAERGGAAPTEADRAALALAAIEEANRRIGAGDYIGARDRLQHAVTFGEERARALLEALD